jgi:hypothetical protein
VKGQPITEEQHLVCEFASFQDEEWTDTNYQTALVEAERIVASRDKAMERFIQKYLHLEDLRSGQDSATDAMKRRLRWGWKVSRGMEADTFTKRMIKAAVDDGDNDLLSYVFGKAIPRDFDKFRWCLIWHWARRLPKPLNCPAFCFWTDQAITDFASCLCSRHTLDQVRKIRSRELKLVRAKKPLVRGFFKRDGKYGVILAKSFSK